jgi:hypothetical protein
VYSRENPFCFKQVLEGARSRVSTGPESTVQRAFRDRNQAKSGDAGGFSGAGRMDIAADFF